MKKLALYICVLMGMPSVFGQELQLPSGNQYLADSEFLIMPTYAGIGNNVMGRSQGGTGLPELIGRYALGEPQWTGVELV